MQFISLIPIECQWSTLISGDESWGKFRRGIRVVLDKWRNEGGKVRTSITRSAFLRNYFFIIMKKEGRKKGEYETFLLEFSALETINALLRDIETYKISARLLYTRWKEMSVDKETRVFVLYQRALTPFWQHQFSRTFQKRLAQQNVRRTRQKL